MALRDYHVPDFDPVADEDATVTAPNCRFTVLTPRVIRFEYDPDEEFEDRPSQLVWYRNRPVPEFDVERSDDEVVIETEALALRYEVTEEGFTPETLSVELADGTTYAYGDEPEENLGGALRTLDRVDGATDVEDSLLSRDGWSVVDDTDRLVFGDDGWVRPREAADEYEDLYFFGYGTDYATALSEFTDLAGDVPLLPRWALGNWWSRYWEYTQSELRELMTEFRERDLPLSVCVVDMDWHVVDNDYHDGWTGWTWNDEYFPDPEGFVDWLHGEGLRTTLNLHPADGVHPHEDQYEAFAEDVGVDPESERPVEFDATDTEFLRGYFEHLIDPMEDEEGIDFWWIDWQQWQESPEMDGLDPLWALNHLHALDRTRDGRRPFILSRWSELGGHRYQVGFSGDAVVSWDSLRFQPYLTAASANVEFGWWSHDVGGHMCGVGDPDAFGELYARWAQFGALSPINRIHTTKTPSIDKRPWQYDGATYDAIADSLRLRHRLVPYLYTMSWRDHADSRPLVRPMYFRYPETEAAYHCPHQYYFGSELLVAPHLSPLDDDTNLSRRSVWLPGGPETDEADAGDGPAGGAPDEWVDFFTGERYDPGFHARYGDLDDLPVYAPAGAVVPLGPEVGWGGIDNPVRLEVVAVPGADGEFTLFEDDGETLAHRDGEYATTRMALEDDGDAATFAVEPAEGDLSEIPGERDYAISFRGVVEPDDVTVDADVDALDVSYREETETAVVELTGVDVTDGLAVIVETDSASLTDTRDRTEERAEDLLRHFEMPVVAEDRLRGVTLGETESAENLWDPESFDWLTDFLQALTASQRRAVFETLTGAGVDLLDHDGDERAVVWNRDEREDVTYRYTAWDTGALHHEYGGESDRGVAPAFGVFELGRDDVDAEVSVTYDGLATVACESPPDEG